MDIQGQRTWPAGRHIQGILVAMPCEKRESIYAGPTHKRYGRQYASDGRQALLSANRRTFGSVCQCQRLAIANCNATQRREGPSQQARMAHPDACHLSTASILLRVLPACVPLGGHALTLDRRRVTVSRSRTMSTCPGPASLRMPCRSSRGPGGALSLSLPLSVRCRCRW